MNIHFENVSRPSLDCSLSLRLPLRKESQCHLLENHAHGAFGPSPFRNHYRQQMDSASLPIELVAAVKCNGKREAYLFPLLLKVKGREKQACLAGLCFDTSSAWKEKVLHLLQDSPEMQADGAGYQRVNSSSLFGTGAYGILSSLGSEERLFSLHLLSACHGWSQDNLNQPTGEVRADFLAMCWQSILPGFPCAMTLGVLRPSRTK